MDMAASVETLHLLWSKSPRKKNLDGTWDWFCLRSTWRKKKLAKSVINGLDQLVA